MNIHVFIAQPSEMDLMCCHAWFQCFCKFMISVLLACADTLVD